MQRVDETNAQLLEQQLAEQTTKIDSLDSAWLTELAVEEERLLNTMAGTMHEIDGLLREDVNAGLLITEFNDQMRALEARRDELKTAIGAFKQQVHDHAATKAEGLKTLAASDAQIEQCFEQYLIAKQLKAECRKAVRVLETEQRACEEGVAEYDAEFTALGISEALARATLVEEEDKLAQLLIEEHELVKFSREKEMEAASRIARQHLEKIVRNRWCELDLSHGSVPQSVHLRSHVRGRN